MVVRFLIFFLGLTFLALGIATVTCAGLGTGTISSVAFVLSEASGLSLGLFVFLTNVFFFFLQIGIDWKQWWLKALKQIPICFIFATLVDVAMKIMALVPWNHYAEQFLMVIVGTILTGFGISSLVFARLAILPPEGFVLSIMKRWGGSFGNLRTCLLYTSPSPRDA